MKTGLRSGIELAATRITDRARRPRRGREFGVGSVPSGRGGTDGRPAASSSGRGAIALLRDVIAIHKLAARWRDRTIERLARCGSPVSPVAVAVAIAIAVAVA